jgi:hypothetical protein
MRLAEDRELVGHAIAYVHALYRELTAENAAPTLGTQNQVVDFILDDRQLRDAVADWARRRRPDEARIEPPQRLPADAAYRRIAAKLKAVMTGPRLPPTSREQG